MFWTKMRKKIFVLAAAAFLAAGMENFEVVSLAAPAENGIGPGFDNMPEEASAETGETAETGGEASAETGETAETGGKHPARPARRPEKPELRRLQRPARWT